MKDEDLCQYVKAVGSQIEPTNSGEKFVKSKLSGIYLEEFLSSSFKSWRTWLGYCKWSAYSWLVWSLACTRGSHGRYKLWLQRKVWSRKMFFFRNSWSCTQLCKCFEDVCLNVTPGKSSDTGSEEDNKKEQI